MPRVSLVRSTMNSAEDTPKSLQNYKLRLRGAQTDASVLLEAKPMAITHNWSHRAGPDWSTMSRNLKSARTVESAILQENCTSVSSAEIAGWPEAAVLGKKKIAS